jgi:hypothetical protein
MIRISKLSALAKQASLTATAALVLSTSACSNGTSAMLEGRWVGDSVANFNAQDVPMATGWALGTAFEFAGEQLSVQIPAEPARAGTFEVIESNGDEVTIEVERPDGLVDTAKFRIEDDQLRWLLGGDRELVLRRSAVD